MADTVGIRNLTSIEDITHSLNQSVNTFLNYAKPIILKRVASKNRSINLNEEQELPEEDFQQEDQLHNEHKSQEAANLPEQEENAKETFKNYQTAFSNLKIAVQDNFLAAPPAEQKKIGNFVAKFEYALTIITQRKNQPDFVRSKAAIKECMKAMRRCKTLSESAEPVITPLAYAVGGLLGLVVGTVAGMIAGPIICLIGVLGSGGSFPTDPLAIQMLFYLSVAAGGLAGAYLGTLHFAKGLGSGSHRFFKPHQTINDVGHNLVQCNKIIEDVLRKRALNDATKLPNVLSDLIAAYAASKNHNVIPHAHARR